MLNWFKQKQKNDTYQRLKAYTQLKYIDTRSFCGHLAIELGVFKYKIKGKLRESRGKIA